VSGYTVDSVVVVAKSIYMNIGVETTILVRGMFVTLAEELDAQSMEDMNIRIQL